MVTISGLTFGYKKKKMLFEQLDLSLSEGRIYGLFGKNGTGKTTLLNLICGLLFPRQGELLVNGYVPGKRKVGFLQNIFLVPEEFEMPDFTPMEQIKAQGWFYPNFDKASFLVYLEELEVDADAKYKDMSMGQRKKALIAFALACNTQLLIMDEPTNGLDIPSKVQFRRLMASVMKEDRCIFISTHQVRDLENLIDVLLVLDRHRIVFQQNVEVIAEKLSFVKTASAEAVAVAIYEEPDLLGRKYIQQNGKDVPSYVDMELLFNGIIAAPDQINAVFTDKITLS